MKKSVFALIIGFSAFLSACQNTTAGSPQLEAQKANLRKIANSEKVEGNTTEASAIENQLINLEANEPESFLAMSKILQKQGRKQESLELLQTGEQLNPNDEKLRLALAIELIENNQNSEGLAKLKTIKTLKNKDYYNGLGVANDKLGEHEAAQDAFDEGIAKYPKDDLLKNNLALSLIFTRDYQEAIEILKPLTKKPNAKVKYRHNLALAYGMSGKYEEAAKVLSYDLNKKKVDENIKAYKEMRERK